MDSKELLRATFTKLLSEVTPQKLIKKGCSLEGDILRIEDSIYDLKKYKNIYLFGSGKAVLPMAQSIHDILNNRIKETFLVGAYRQNIDLKDTTYIQSSHPIPSQKSIDSASKLRQRLENLKEDDLFIYLLSGGTSSLLEIPEKNIKLEDMQKTTDTMLKNGLTIEEMNCVRKHISKIKGGKLAKNIKAKGIVLVLSDVLGDNLQAIGSAPLYFDTTTFKQALFYLKKHDIFDKIPTNVQTFINEGVAQKQRETPKNRYDNIEHFVLGSNKTILKKADELLKPYMKTVIIQKPIKDEVSTEAKRLLDFAKQNIKTKACFIFGGECTVKIDREGVGGRNQHLALTFLSNFNLNSHITILCGATDGIDGNSTAAGAVLETQDFSDIQKSEAKEYLANFNSNLYLKKRGDLLHTGSTHNNLLDIVIMVIN